ncbi:MAG: TldD/PmbA family protein [Myxococcales bacterium]
MDYAAIAKKVVERARRKGASQAEAWLELNRESSVKVRDGEVEDLTQATSKGVGLRVFVDGRLGFACTSDFRAEALESFVDRAVALARQAAPDRNNGLPEKPELKKRNGDLQLFDEKVASLSPEWKLQAALEMEKAGKAVDPRVQTFESVGVGENVGDTWFASSTGVTDHFRSTAAYLYAAPVAAENGQLQTSYWLDYKRFLDELQPPEEVGREAAKRAVRMLGAKKAPTQRVPVIFDPRMAASFIAGIAGAINGDMVFKKASFLAGKLGKRIAPESITVVDDGLMPRGLGTSPFDGEGVPTRRTSIVEGGVLQSYLYDSFTARKAKASSTANAARSYASLPHIGLNNFYLQPGQRSPEEIIGEVKSGLYVTSMLGRGANPVTGDYSRGANGLWIENGELAWPVQEITVAGNMLEMLMAIDAVGNDLEFRGSVAAPTLRFAELAVSGA